MTYSTGRHSSPNGAVLQAAVLQYGVDFLRQWSAVVHPPNGAMITTCICHACNWTAFELQGKNSIAHYADWSSGPVQQKSCFLSRSQY